MSKIILGGHVSAAGGISQSLSRAKAIGGNAVQIFSASPRVWKRMQISTTEVEKFNELKKSLGIEASVIHAIYLLNLASENSDLASKSREVIEYDLKVDALTHGVGVVVHLGSHLGRGFDAVKEQLVDQIKTVLSNTPETSTFLIENSAGQKGKLASNLEDIRYLMDAVGSARLGWCLDTCHAFANGYALNTANYQSPISNVQSELIPAEQLNIFSEIEKYNLWESLKVIHLNDSRDPAASGRDRHANIGMGEIGEQVLKSFLSHPKIQALPIILEVPGMDGKSGPDLENINKVKSLIAG